MTRAHQPQYLEWGLLVRTGRVQAAHIMNGIVHLLATSDRVSPPGRVSDLSELDRYLKRVIKETPLRPRLSDVAKCLCVTHSKPPGGRAARCRVTLDENTLESGGYRGRGLTSLLQRLRDEEGQPLRGLDWESHELLARVFNADGRVYDSGGEDPTTPGFALAGSSTTHTLAGGHAVTMLGALSQTEQGRRALCELWNRLAEQDDPHSALAAALGARTAADDLGHVARPPAAIDDCPTFPLPPGDSWVRFSEKVGDLCSSLLGVCRDIASKAETLMAFADLAMLVLALRMLHWGGEQDESSGPLILVSPLRRATTGEERQLIRLAKQSLRFAFGRLQDRADAKGMIHVSSKRSRNGKKKAKPNKYPPELQAGNLAASGGWCYPLDARGGSVRFLAPGPRQLATLVMSLLGSEPELPWPDFARRSEELLGLALGGPGERRVAARLGLAQAPVSVIRNGGRLFRRELVALGLAREESDDIVIVDGGVLRRRGSIGRTQGAR